MCGSCVAVAERGSFSEIGPPVSKERGLGNRGTGKCGSFIGQSKLRMTEALQRQERLGHVEECGGKRREGVLA